MAANRARLIALPTSQQPGILDMLKFSVMPLATALGRLAGAEADLARAFDLRGLPHHLHGILSFLG